MKDAIMSFLRRGLYEGTKYTPGDFMNKLSFLVYLIKLDANFPVGAISNDNWFWKYPNEKNRLQLIDDIRRVKRFAETDPSYEHIMWRVSNGDAYGILKPVRDIEEEVDNKSHKYALAYYESKGTPVKKSDADNPALRYKLVYCNENNLPLNEVLEWDLYERLLRATLNYREYKVVDDFVYASPFELQEIYMSPEYAEVINSMKGALANYYTDLKFISSVLVIKIIKQYQDGDVQGSFALFKELQSHYDYREGVSQEEKDELSKKLASYTKRIPTDILTEMLKLGGKIVL